MLTFKNHLFLFRGFQNLVFGSSLQHTGCPADSSPATLLQLPLSSLTLQSVAGPLLAQVVGLRFGVAASGELASAWDAAESAALYG